MANLLAVQVDPAFDVIAENLVGCEDSLLSSLHSWLKDDQRALIWIDGRLRAVAGPGLCVMWTVFHEVRVEVIDIEPVRL